MLIYNNFFADISPPDYICPNRQCQNYIKDDRLKTFGSGIRINKQEMTSYIPVTFPETGAPPLNRDYQESILLFVEMNIFDRPISFSKKY